MRDKITLCYRDPSAWRNLSLEDRLSAIYHHYCTGPCGQGGNVLAIRGSTASALKETVAEIDRLRARVAELEAAGRAARAAIHDAIRRPMGVEPDSATEALQSLRDAGLDTPATEGR